MLFKVSHKPAKSLIFSDSSIYIALLQICMQNQALGRIKFYPGKEFSFERRIVKFIHKIQLKEETQDKNVSRET